MYILLGILACFIATFWLMWSLSPFYVNLCEVELPNYIAVV